MADRPSPVRQSGAIRFAVTGMLLSLDFGAGAGVLGCKPPHTNVGPHEEPPADDSGSTPEPTDASDTTPEEPPATDDGGGTEPQTSPEPPTGDPAKPPVVVVNPGPQKPPTTPPPK